MPRSSLDSLEHVAKRRRARRGTVLFHEGDPGDSIYILLSGSVKAVLYGGQGKATILSTFRPGECLGVVCALEKVDRHYTAVLREDSEFLMIPMHAFQELCVSDSALMSSLIKMLAYRYRSACKRIEALGLLDVYSRVVHFLSSHAVPRGEVLVVEERFTHQEIANWVGASRERVSRIVKGLVSAGIISRDKKQIRINKKLPSSY